MKTTFVFTVLALMWITSHAQDAQRVKGYAVKKQSIISYSMNHPLHAWTGECKDVTSVIMTDAKKEIVYQVAVSVKVSAFDSKNANRDSHMMEVTEALKFPSISFASTSIQQEGNRLMVTGTLNFHGVAQTVSFEAEKKMNNDKMEVTGSFVVKMTQFKIEPPSLMGFATEDEIKVSFKTVY